MSIKLVFAMDQEGGFGYKGKLPWPKLKGDLVNFAEETEGHTLIMGRKTFESLPKLLPGRTHVVLSSSFDITSKDGYAPHMIIQGGLEQALAEVEGDVAIIGGANLLEQGMLYADKLCVTLVKGSYLADVYIDITDFGAYKPVEVKHTPEFNVYYMEK